MAKKASVNVSKNSLEQVQARLGSMAYTLEQDLNNIISLLSLVNYNWQSDRTKEYTDEYVKNINDIKEEQKTIVENIRKFLDSVNVKYSTAEKKLNSNADRFKR